MYVDLEIGDTVAHKENPNRCIGRIKDFEWLGAKCAYVLPFGNTHTCEIIRVDHLLLYRLPDSLLC